MQILKCDAFHLRRKNLVNRLQTRVKLSIEPIPPIKVLELPKLTELPTPKTPPPRKEFISHEYKLIEKRLGKKLAAKGMLSPPIIYDCTPPTQQTPIVKIKGGFMDNIGEIIDSNYNTISLSKNKIFNL